MVDDWQWWQPDSEMGKGFRKGEEALRDQNLVAVKCCQTLGFGSTLRTGERMRGEGEHQELFCGIII